MNEEIKKFAFFRSYAEAVHDLPADVYKEAMNALLDYVFSGVEPDNLSPYANMFFTLVKPTVDSSIKMAKGGAKGGEASRKPSVSLPEALDKGEVTGYRNMDIGIKDKDKGIKDKGEKKKKAVIPPTLDEVSAYIREKGYSVNAEQWWNYYNANGWHVGKNKMADWKASVRYWESKNKPTAKPAGPTWDPNEDIYAKWRKRGSSDQGDVATG